MAEPIVLVHGGAQDTLPTDPDDEAAVRGGLERAVRAGLAVLADGGAALDAAIASVRVLEDDEHFNAGRGASLEHDGTVQLDACVMDGHGLRAGGVIGARRVRNPVLGARAVLDHSGHVLLAGEAVDALAAELGLELQPNDWFVTDAARAKLAAERPGFGTVGAVVLDAQGRVAAATSTGGLSGSRPGRVSDSALPGAGTWADDMLAVSATGDGEYFQRSAFAHRVAAAIAAGAEPAAAADAALRLVARLGGSGGCIVVGRDGSFAARANTPCLRRGVGRDGHVVVALRPDEWPPTA